MANPKTTRDKPDDAQALREAINEFDCRVQDASEKIGAIAEAARGMLRPDAASLVHVDQLLTTISDLVADLENAINSRAEDFGAQYRDDDMQRRHRAIYTACNGTGIDNG